MSSCLYKISVGKDILLLIGVTSSPVTSKPKNQLSNFLIDFSRSIYTDQLAQGRHLKSCHLKTEMGVQEIQ